MNRIGALLCRVGRLPALPRNMWLVQRLSFHARQAQDAGIAALLQHCGDGTRRIVRGLWRLAASDRNDNDHLCPRPSSGTHPMMLAATLIACASPAVSDGGTLRRHTESVRAARIIGMSWQGRDVPM